MMPPRGRGTESCHRAPFLRWSARGRNGLHPSPNGDKVELCDIGDYSSPVEVREDSEGDEGTLRTTGYQGRLSSDSS